MAFTTNNQEESKPKGLYWGLANMNIQAINPNNSELEAMKMNTKDEEPDYLIKDQNDGKVVGFKVVVYLKSAEEDKSFYTRDIFRVYNSEFYSEKTGKFQYINKEGKSAWAENENDLTSQFTAVGGVRKSLKGLDKLLEFMRCFFDIRPGHECSFTAADIKAFMSSNFSMLKDLTSGYKDFNKIKYILGISTYTNDKGEEKHSQSLISNLVYRPYAQANEWMQKSVDYYNENTDPQYLALVPEFPYLLDTWTPGKTSKADMSNTSEDESDDLPF